MSIILCNITIILISSTSLVMASESCLFGHQLGLRYRGHEKSLIKIWNRKIKNNTIDDADEKIDILDTMLTWVGIEKLQKALTSDQPVVVSDGMRTVEEIFNDEKDHMLSPFLIIESHVNSNNTHPLADAIYKKIASIEQKDGYRPEGEIINGKYEFRNNYLAPWTKYWHEKYPDGSPCIRYRATLLRDSLLAQYGIENLIKSIAKSKGK